MCPIIIYLFLSVIVYVRIYVCMWKYIHTHTHTHMYYSILIFNQVFHLLRHQTNLRLWQLMTQW